MQMPKGFSEDMPPFLSGKIMQGRKEKNINLNMETGILSGYGKSSVLLTRVDGDGTIDEFVQDLFIEMFVWGFLLCIAIGVFVNLSAMLRVNFDIANIDSRLLLVCQMFAVAFIFLIASEMWSLKKDLAVLRALRKYHNYRKAKSKKVV